MHVCPHSRARNLGRAGAPTSKPNTRFTTTKRVSGQIVEHHARHAPLFDTCGRAGGLGPGGERQNGAGITPVVGSAGKRLVLLRQVEWPPPFSETPRAAALHCWTTWCSFPQGVRPSSGER